MKYFSSFSPPIEAPFVLVFCMHNQLPDNLSMKCSPHSGEFSGENIRLGSRGDSYYEYLIKVWLQQRAIQDGNFTYLYDMYEEAMKGVRHLLVQKSIPNELVFVGELPYGPKGSFSPKMDHLVCDAISTLKF